MSDDPNSLPRLLEAPALAGVATNTSLFCVIDAASDERIYPALRGFAAKERIVPLYQGTAATQLAAVAPYLVEPMTNGALLPWLFDELADIDWGILVWSASPLDEVHRHFRRLGRVRTQDGRILLFRYYDPRVLAIFLPICDAAQLEELFGPIALFGAAASGTSEIMLFACTSGTLRQIPMTLESAG